MSSRIKNTVNAKQVVEMTEYPKLMQSKLTGVIVLFSGHGVGIVVGGINGAFGSYRSDWAVESFKSFCGSVTIEQE